MGFHVPYSGVILFCLTSTVVQSFGELLVLRHPVTDNYSRKLTCVSENDDGALIWNHDNTENTFDFTNFQPTKRPSENMMKCAIWNSTECHAHWEYSKEWYSVSSKNEPMAPVSDFRWEGFEEYFSADNISDARYRYVGQVKESSGTTVFSARGNQNVFILLCVNADPTKGLCFWIILGGHEGSTCIIRYCARGAPENRTPSTKGNCSDLRMVLKKYRRDYVLNAYEWRTFRLTWNRNEKTIRVFKDSDPENKPFLEGKTDEWGPVSVSHLSIRSEIGGRVRFHFYDYILTKDKNAIISTAKFNHDDENFCVELLFGLCPKCKLNVTLVHRKGGDIKSWIITGYGNATYGGLLTWESIRLTEKLKRLDLNGIRLRIRTILDEDGDKGRWAIDNFRLCKLADKTRVSTITIREEVPGSGLTWPEVKCQKLSYSGNTLVDSLSTETINSKTSLELRQYTKLVESCGSPCGNFGDKSSSLCSSEGCICSRGYNGNDCSRECSDGYYGYNCKEICGSCRNEACDKVTGSCGSGCVPRTPLLPNCKLEGPIVTNITDTTAVILQYLELASHVEVGNLFVEIRSRSAAIQEVFTLGLAKSEIPSIYKSYTQNLTVDTIYAAQTILEVKQGRKLVNFTGQETIFTTTCLKNPNFILTTEEKKLTVNMPGGKRCVNNPRRSYRVRVYDPATNKTYKNQVNPKFPVIATNLSAYTEYQVIIEDNTIGVQVFSERKRTLESAPSAVDKLIRTSSDTQIALRWNPPLKKNGVIRYYNVSLTEKKLLGCPDDVNARRDKRVVIRTVNDTMTNFTDLHPYAVYEITVIAYTIKPGEPRTVYIQTRETDIPTSRISNLRLSADNRDLEWNEPEDCTTITGRTMIKKLFFTGISDSVRNWTAMKQSSYSRIKLYDTTKLQLASYTLYMVRVHVIRDYGLPENPDIYQNLTWRTQPSAPTKVRNLIKHDADSVKNTISLRWLPPDPANGEIESYRVASVTTKKTEFFGITIKVSDERLKCELKWKDYVCLKDFHIPSPTETKEVRIEVGAFNKNVKEPGVLNYLPINFGIYDTRPSEPKISTIIPLDFGIVTLKWTPPMQTDTKITSFYIQASFVSTKLQPNRIEKSPISIVHLVKSNQTEYSVELHLLTSTNYNVSVVTVNQRNFTSTKSSQEIWVPGRIGFTSREKLQVRQIDTSIKVTVPAVVNATDGTWVRVIVKGLTMCTPRNSRTPTLPVQKTEWEAAIYKIENNRQTNLTIGAQHSHNVSFNCSFDMGETYTISSVAKDEYSTASATLESSSITLTIQEKSPPSNLTWLYIFPVLVFCALLGFWGYRKRSMLMQLGRNNLNTENLAAPWNQLIPSRKNNRAPSQQTTPDVVPYDPHSYPVEIEEFEEYIKEALASGLLESQYKLFTRGLTKACEYGKLAENRTKNRYKDLIAYDESRVVLKKIPGDDHSDYINASYIQGYKNEKVYIATQGPKPNTVNDFWRMIWQKDVRVICMLANVIEGGKTKCHQYWPEVRCNAEYGDILVSNTGQEIFVDYTFRTFLISFGKDKRVVTHLHYTGWPDHGVPMYIQSLIPYLKKLQDTTEGNGPVVVHCSAGVGRTGTIILCDICLNRAKEERIIDLPAVTVEMRQHRANMVDNAQQYLLAHLVIAEYLVSNLTLITCNSSLQDKIKELRKELPSHAERLKDIVWQDRALHSFGLPAHLIPEDVTGDRISGLVPISPDLPNFEPFPKFNNQSKYLTTLYVDGLKMKNQYIASPQPSPANWSDLWRRIADDNVELVIILQSPDPEDSTICDIVPNDLSPEPMQHIQVEPKTDHLDNEKEDFPIDRLVLNGEGAEPQPVTVLTCTGWGCGKGGKPPPASTLVSLWRASEKISRKEGPTFVICHDGVTGCGLYLALSFLLERMAVAGECDVISAVRAVRRYKSEFVESLEQFEYLYDAAVEYDKCFQTYANFS